MCYIIQDSDDLLHLASTLAGCLVHHSLLFFCNLMNALIVVLPCHCHYLILESLEACVHDSKGEAVEEPHFELWQPDERQCGVRLHCLATDINPSNSTKYLPLTTAEKSNVQTVLNLASAVRAEIKEGEKTRKFGTGTVVAASAMRLVALFATKVLAKYNSCGFSSFDKSDKPCIHTLFNVNLDNDCCVNLEFEREIFALPTLPSPFDSISPKMPKEFVHPAVKGE